MLSTVRTGPDSKEMPLCAEFCYYIEVAPKKFRRDTPCERARYETQRGWIQIVHIVSSSTVIRRVVFVQVHKICYRKTANPIYVTHFRRVDLREQSGDVVRLIDTRAENKGKPHIFNIRKRLDCVIAHIFFTHQTLLACKWSDIYFKLSNDPCVCVCVCVVLIYF